MNGRIERLRSAPVPVGNARAPGYLDAGEFERTIDLLHWTVLIDLIGKPSDALMFFAGRETINQSEEQEEVYVADLSMTFLVNRSMLHDPFRSTSFQIA
jgi:hypothetical protein